MFWLAYSIEDQPKGGHDVPFTWKAKKLSKLITGKLVKDNLQEHTRFKDNSHAIC